MKKKIIGIFVCMLLIATAVLPKVPDVSAEETGGSGEQDVRVFNLTDQNVLQSNDVKDVFIYDVTKDDIDYTTWYNDSSLGWWQEINKSKFPVLWNKLGSKTEVNNSEIGYNGTIVGTVSFDTVKFGNGTKVNDANGNYITFNDGGTIINTEQGAVEFWVKFEDDEGSWSGNDHFFSSYQPSPPYDGVKAFMGTGNGGQIIFYLADNGKYVSATNLDWSAGDMWHLAFVWNKNGIDGSGNTIAIYKDGVQIAADTDDLSAFDNTGNFQVGANIGGGTEPFGQGYIDNVKVYDCDKTNFEDRFIEDSGDRSTHFPTKSYLIATDLGLDIIDASDNKLWMRFIVDGNTWSTHNILPRGTNPPRTIESVYCLNGNCYVGQYNPNFATGFFRINFVGDNSTLWNYDNRRDYNGDISERNDGKGSDADGDTFIQKDPYAHSVNDIVAKRINGFDYVFFCNGQSGQRGGFYVFNNSNNSGVKHMAQAASQECSVDIEGYTFIYSNTTHLLRENSLPNSDWTPDDVTVLLGIQDIVASDDEIFVATEDGIYVVDSTTFVAEEGYTYDAVVIKGNANFIDGNSRITASIPNDLLYQKNFSTEFWVYYDSYQPGGSAAGYFCYFHPSGGNYPRVAQAWYRYAGYYIAIQLAYGGGWQVWGFTPTDYNIEDAWHHFALTFNYTDGRVQLYRSGKLVFSDTSTQSPGYVNELVVGNHYWLGYWNAGFYGHVDDLRVYQRILIPEEINNSYQRGLQGLPSNNSNPVLYYSFDNDATDYASGYDGNFAEGASLIFNVSDAVHRNFAGSSNNVASLVLADDNTTLYVGTNDGNDGGGISKIDTMTGALLSNWTSGNNEALVDYDITSLSFWQHPDNVNVWELLVGTENGASVIFAEEPPETTKTIGDPKYGDNDEWVTSATEFNLTATDDISGVGVIYYRTWYNNVWNPEPGTGVGINNNFMEYSGNFTLSPEGKHYIEYYSLDNAGNVEGVHNQTHYVDDPVEMINDVIEDIEDMGLRHGIENSLTQKLNNVTQSLGNGQTNAAINQLNAFINQVEAQRGKKLTDEQADALVNVAQQIIDYINNL